MEKQPVVHLIPLPRALGIANLVLGIIPLDQVLHDASRLEEVDRLSVGEFISQGRNASIGVNLEEPRLLLCVFAYVDFVGIVRDAAIGLVCLFHSLRL